MQTDILHLLGVVAVGWAVTFAMRALPFVLFGSRRRALPPAVERLSAFVSPVIIAALIVYSYSGLAWRTPYPYVAGALTVALHVWRRNALFSIVAGTIAYMLLLNGCASGRALELDPQNPPFRYTDHGIWFGEERLEVADVPEILDDFDVPKDRVIYVQIDPNETKSLADWMKLKAALGRAGYKRSVLVTKQHAESRAIGKRPTEKSARGSSASRSANAARPVRKIRYKKANE